MHSLIEHYKKESDFKRNLHSLDILQSIEVAMANNGYQPYQKEHRLMSQLTFQPADTGLLIGQ